MQVRGTQQAGAGTELGGGPASVQPLGVQRIPDDAERLLDGAMSAVRS